MTAAGDRLTLQIERPAVGGRMIARHDGAVVLVAGAIPGERVVARVERVRQRTVFAATVEVLEASPDRVAADPDLACGGHVLAHVSAPRQAALKAEIVADAFRRQGRLQIDAPPVVESPADGYRTRARAHVRHGRWGFFAEGSHLPCRISGSRQLSTSSAQRLEALCAEVAQSPSASAEIAWAESVIGDRAVALVRGEGLTRRADARPVVGLDGLGWAIGPDHHPTVLWGDLSIVDRLGTDAGTVDVRHHVESFFQGNRFLLQPLVDDVRRRVEPTRIADLYAGVGLFSLRLASDGARVIAVEGDRQAAADLAINATRADTVAVVASSVEAFVASGRLTEVDTIVVDPPRAGLAVDVTRGLCASPAARVVYVSCDPATLARDVGQFVAAGFALREVRAFDLFPRTAHVETVVTLDR